MQLSSATPLAETENLDVYPAAPEGFNVARENIPHGEVKVVEYDSKTLGLRRMLRVYLPPGYTTDRKFPVLYLQHGLGNTSTEWTQRARAPIIIDNLLADKKIQQPFIIVFPSGNATATMTDEKQGDRTQESYGTPYHEDLLKEIIPFVESHYSVYPSTGATVAIHFFERERSGLDFVAHLGRTGPLGSLLTALRTSSPSAGW